MSVANNSPSQNSSHQDDHFQSSHIKEMDVLNIEILKFPIQESCGEEEEKDIKTLEIKEKKSPEENGNHSEESSFTSKDTKNTFLLPYAIQCTEASEQFERGFGNSLKIPKRKNRWIVARDGKGKFWEVKLPEFPSQPFQKRKIENEGLRRKKQSVASGVKRKFWEVKLPEFPPQPLKKRRIENKGLRRKKPSVARGQKRKFWEVKLPEVPPQPFKKRKIENDGQWFIEISEKGGGTCRGHENTSRCSDWFDPGGSH